MQRADSDRLRLCRVAIVDDLDVERIIAPLIQGGIVTSEDYQLICSKPTTQDRARYFLDILPTKGPKAFCTFVQALKDYGYDWLADRLTNQ